HRTILDDLARDARYIFSMLVMISMMKQERRSVYVQQYRMILDDLEAVRDARYMFSRDDSRRFEARDARYMFSTQDDSSR
ncbi:hypothetical protein AVEN_51458-1, partial [Araneus ventricosus]